MSIHHHSNQAICITAVISSLLPRTAISYHDGPHHWLTRGMPSPIYISVSDVEAVDPRHVGPDARSDHHGRSSSASRGSPFVPVLITSLRDAGHVAILEFLIFDRQRIDGQLLRRLVMACRVKGGGCCRCQDRCTRHRPCGVRVIGSLRVESVSYEIIEVVLTASL